MAVTEKNALEHDVLKTTRDAHYDPIGPFLKIKEVCVETGLSRATIYRCIQSDRNPFPKPVKIGNASRWALCEIIEWKKEVLMQREGAG